MHDRPTPIDPAVTEQPSTTQGVRVAIVGCGVLLLAYSVLAWSAARTKNATIDEPLHALSGWLELRHHDYRIDLENTSLWKCWASLPNVATRLTVTFDEPAFADPAFDPPSSIRWASRTLFTTPGNNGDAFIDRGRMMMLIVAVALGAMIGGWALRAGGPTAAVVAVGLFALDPNFLAHGPLIKSDVALALSMLYMSYACWRLGQRVTIGRVTAVALGCAIGVNVKFSGLLLPPILAGLLVVRTLLPWRWDACRRSAASRARRAVISAATLLVVAVTCWAVTWAAYGFRYRPAPWPTAAMNMEAIRDRTTLVEATAANPVRRATAEERSAWQPGLVTRFVDFADRHHLMPQAWLAGLLYQHACTMLWPSYLMGQFSGVGWWYYFPLAMLFKTPTATLAAALAAAAVVGAALVSRSMGRTLGTASWMASPDRARRWWLMTCLVVPAAIFTAAALRTNLNIGVRNVLPLYPPAFVGIGIVAEVARRRWRRGVAIVLFTLFAGLATETLAAWPNYLAFFNAPAGGARGGFSLLGDSNLDWGQDIRNLARWQRAHPDVPIYMSYYGTVDPHYYGLKFHPLLVAEDGLTPASDGPMAPGVLAVSATHLQGLYVDQRMRTLYRVLAQRQPDETIGDSIYLYRFPR